MTGWNFPSNGGGAINGIADSGIQIFAGKEIPSLVRETCQNSLDAAAKKDTAVNVEFERYEIAPKDIPGVREYEKFLRSCRTFWRGNVKAEAFISEALLKLKYAATSVLRISDFHTTGLSEPFDARAMTGWNTLTKINGGTTKSDIKAGNFGIGKNAPFANSFFRMVFYRTLNQRWERAAQAVTKLVSFNLDENNIAAGTGYYGEKNGSMPVPHIPALEKIHKRTGRGTDLFIYGFNGGNNWADELIGALVENFLVAIYRDNLQVTVQREHITRNTLGKFVTGDVANYYKILTDDGDVRNAELDFHGMGKLKLRALFDDNVKLNRRVLIVRKNGMKLFELDRFPKALNFTAILELEGNDLNAFFREIETPDHTDWEPSRHPTRRKDATKYLAELKSWTRKTIPTLAATPTTNTDTQTPVEPTTPGQSKRISCDKLRVIKIGERTYRLIVNVPQTIASGRIEISALGESNSGEKLFITQAASDNSNVQINSSGDEIAFKNLRGNIDARINFELPQDRHYALEVAVYEN